MNKRFLFATLGMAIPLLIATPIAPETEAVLKDIPPPIKPRKARREEERRQRQAAARKK